MQTAPAPTPSPQRADPKGQTAGGAPTRSAGLIALVRKLLAVGKALIETAMGPSGEDAQTMLPLRFGTFNIALIIARITRGLRLAEALEARLIRNARRLDQPCPRATRLAASQPKRDRSPPSKALSPEADDAALLARLPSAKAIAAQVRRTPIGVILDDICQDLGIDCAHPLWREIRTAIIANGGSLERHLNGIAARQRPMQSALPSTRVPPLTPAFLTPALAIGTGPP